MKGWLHWRKRQFTPTLSEAEQGAETASLDLDFCQAVAAAEQAFRLYMQEQAKALDLWQQSKQVPHR
jgi:hypothetical protein